MVLINIDDRDTHNYYSSQVTTKKFKEWLLQLKSEIPSAIINHLGNGIYKIDISPIQCTGSDVNTIFMIPFMHKLLKIAIKHTDLNDINSIDLLTYSVSHLHSPNLSILINSMDDIIVSDIIDEYDGYHHVRGQYLLISNTTHTDKLYVSIYINITGE